MQIVIDIPESIYDTIQADEMISREQLAVLQMHILNGTPLPTDAVDRVTIKEYLESFGTAYELGKEKGLDIALDILDKYTEEGNEKIIRDLPSETPQPCDDCISRSAVIAIAGDSCLDLDSYEDTREFCDEINDLPSVIPQPKMGSSSGNPNKWIPITSRPMTEEEKEHYKTHPEYQDDCRIFNCKLPDD